MQKEYNYKLAIFLGRTYTFITIFLHESLFQHSSNLLKLFELTIFFGEKTGVSPDVLQETPGFDVPQRVWPLEELKSGKNGMIGVELDRLGKVKEGKEVGWDTWVLWYIPYRKNEKYIYRIYIYTYICILGPPNNQSV